MTATSECTGLRFRDSLLSLVAPITIWRIWNGEATAAVYYQQKPSYRHGEDRHHAWGAGDSDHRDGAAGRGIAGQGRATGTGSTVAEGLHFVEGCRRSAGPGPLSCFPTSQPITRDGPRPKRAHASASRTIRPCLAWSGAFRSSLAVHCDRAAAPRLSASSRSLGIYFMAEGLNPTPLIVLQSPADRRSLALAWR
jgi:hypothetical protein